MYVKMTLNIVQPVTVLNITTLHLDASLILSILTILSRLQLVNLNHGLSWDGGREGWYQKLYYLVYGVGARGEKT